MSIPSTTKDEVFVRCWDGLLSDEEAPVVEGNESYTAMIQSLLFLADCRNNVGDRVSPPSFDVIHQGMANWMENKAHTPKFVEDEMLERTGVSSVLCTVCEVSSSLSRRSGVGQQFGRESSVGLGGSSARSLSFHKDSSLADWNHSFRVPQLDMLLGKRISRDRTIEFWVLVCGVWSSGRGFVNPAR
eukprot:scaffold269953_cov66-Attheya_sp.AAC.1